MLLPRTTLPRFFFLFLLLMLPRHEAKWSSLHASSANDDLLGILSDDAVLVRIRASELRVRERSSSLAQLPPPIATPLFVAGATAAAETPTALLVAFGSCIRKGDFFTTPLCGSCSFPGDADGGCAGGARFRRIDALFYHAPSRALFVLDQSLDATRVRRLVDGAVSTVFAPQQPIINTALVAAIAMPTGPDDPEKALFAYASSTTGVVSALACPSSGAAGCYVPFTAALGDGAESLAVIVHDDIRRHRLTAYATVLRGGSRLLCRARLYPPDGAAAVCDQPGGHFLTPGLQLLAVRDALYLADLSHQAVWRIPLALCGCATGYYPSGAGEGDECLPAPPGTYVSDAVLVQACLDPAEAVFHAYAEGKGSCVACPTGSFLPPGTAVCVSGANATVPYLPPPPPSSPWLGSNTSNTNNNTNNNIRNVTTEEHHLLLTSAFHLVAVCVAYRSADRALLAFSQEGFVHQLASATSYSHVVQLYTPCPAPITAAASLPEHPNELFVVHAGCDAPPQLRVWMPIFNQDKVVGMHLLRSHSLPANISVAPLFATANGRLRLGSIWEIELSPQFWVMETTPVAAPALQVAEGVWVDIQSSALVMMRFLPWPTTAANACAPGDDGWPRYEDDEGACSLCPSYNWARIHPEACPPVVELEDVPVPIASLQDLQPPQYPPPHMDLLLPIMPADTAPAGRLGELYETMGAAWVWTPALIRPPGVSTSLLPGVWIRCGPPVPRYAPCECRLPDEGVALPHLWEQTLEDHFPQVLGGSAAYITRTDARGEGPFLLIQDTAVGSRRYTVPPVDPDPNSADAEEQAMCVVGWPAVFRCPDRWLPLHSPGVGGRCVSAAARRTAVSCPRGMVVVTGDRCRLCPPGEFAERGVCVSATASCAVRFGSVADGLFCSGAQACSEEEGLSVATKGPCVPLPPYAPGVASWIWSAGPLLHLRYLACGSPPPFATWVPARAESITMGVCFFRCLYGNAEPEAATRWFLLIKQYAGAQFSGHAIRDFPIPPPPTPPALLLASHAFCPSCPIMNCPLGFTRPQSVLHPCCGPAASLTEKINSENGCIRPCEPPPPNAGFVPGGCAWQCDRGYVRVADRVCAPCAPALCLTGQHFRRDLCEDQELQRLVGSTMCEPCPPSDPANMHQPLNLPRSTPGVCAYDCHPNYTTYEGRCVLCPANARCPPSSRRVCDGQDVCAPCPHPADATMLWIPQDDNDRECWGACSSPGYVPVGVALRRQAPGLFVYPAVAFLDTQRYRCAPCRGNCANATGAAAACVRRGWQWRMSACAPPEPASACPDPGTFYSALAGACVFCSAPGGLSPYALPPNAMWADACRSVCVADHTLVGNDCVPCSALAPTTPTFQAFIAAWDAPPAARWWPPSLDASLATLLPPRRTTGPEPRKGVCWPCPPPTSFLYDAYVAKDPLCIPASLARRPEVQINYEMPVSRRRRLLSTAPTAVCPPHTLEMPSAAACLEQPPPRRLIVEVARPGLAHVRNATACPATHYQSGTKCVQCPAGEVAIPGSTTAARATVNDTYLAEECARRTRGGGPQRMAACLRLVRTMLEAAHAPCICTPGASRQGTVCVPCEVGKFKSFAGNSPCTPCPRNQTTLAPGSTALGSCTRIHAHARSN